jgi:ribonuclease HI
VSEVVRLWVDGGSRGNPGPAATGYRIEDTEGSILEEAGATIGVATNNVAEYRALIAGLRAAAAFGAREVEVRADSQLLMRQMTGAYRVKNAALRELWIEARRVASAFDRVRFVEIPRAENAAADLQVNLALDAAAGG